MTTELTGKQRQFLKALAHALKPVVQVGNKGVTDALLRQIDEQLRVHEMIKVRFNTESESEPAQALTEICAKTKSHMVQHAGRILTLYRRHESAPKIVLPR